jgi:alkylation response protein AidB-like acyl-CoA dehydrogenase
MAIAEAGDTSQHTRWLGDLMDGRTSLCLAHAERTNRFATGDVQTSAVRVGSGWKLTGRKHFVLNGHKADHLVVTATTPDGLGLFVLDRDASGLGITEVRTIDGHGAAMLDLAATIPDDRRLGALGAPALAVVERVLDYGAAAACAEALGVCQAALDLTREHLGTREQFGVPIGSFQALQHRAVDMFVQLELMRSMSILASIRATHVAPHERARAVSAAKAHIGRSGRFITQQAIQLHGGIGITDEHDIGLYFKRMHVLGVLFGDEAHHVGRFAALANHDET